MRSARRPGAEASRRRASHPAGAGAGATGPHRAGRQREEFPCHTRCSSRTETLCEALCAELAADGYEAAAATTPSALALQLENRCPDLPVLGDFEGPGAAAPLLAALRRGQAPFGGLCADTPAIVLAADGGELALLRAFEAGADDFLRKPASYLELRAWIRAVIVRSAGERVPSVRRVGALEIDREGHRAAYARPPARAVAARVRAAGTAGRAARAHHEGGAPARHLGLMPTSA